MFPLSYAFSGKRRLLPSWKKHSNKWKGRASQSLHLYVSSWECKKQVDFPLLFLYSRYWLVLNLKRHIGLWAWIIFSTPGEKRRWFARSSNSQELVSIIQQIINTECQSHSWALRHLNQGLVGPLPSERSVIIRFLTINKLNKRMKAEKQKLSSTTSKTPDNMIHIG